MPCRSPRGEGVVSQDALQVSRGVSRPTPREVSRSTPGGSGLQAHTRGCIQACTEAGSPPPPKQSIPGDTANKRTVRILLKCILVN